MPPKGNKDKDTSVDTKSNLASRAARAAAAAAAAAANAGSSSDSPPVLQDMSSADRDAVVKEPDTFCF